MPDLATLQAQFTDTVITRTGHDDLLAHINGAGLQPAQRVQVHQNNYVLLLEAALANTFPAVHGAVGADFFGFMVRRFVIAHPPSNAALFTYGADFPTFIKELEEAASLPWLPDLAQLEWARAQLLAGEVEAITLHSPFPIDLLWQGMQDPPLIDAAQIDMAGGPVTLKVHFVDDTLYFTR